MISTFFISLLDIWIYFFCEVLQTVFWNKLNAACDKPTLFPTLCCIRFTKRHFSFLFSNPLPNPQCLLLPLAPLLTHIPLPTCWEDLILARDGKLYFRLNGKTQFHFENWNRLWHFRRVHLWKLVFCLMPISYLYYSSVIYHPGIEELSASSVSQVHWKYSLAYI